MFVLKIKILFFNFLILISLASELKASEARDQFCQEMLKVKQNFDSNQHNKLLSLQPKISDILNFLVNPESVVDDAKVEFNYGDELVLNKSFNFILPPGEKLLIIIPPKSLQATKAEMQDYEELKKKLGENFKLKLAPFSKIKTKFDCERLFDELELTELDLKSFSTMTERFFELRDKYIISKAHFYSKRAKLVAPFDIVVQEHLSIGDFVKDWTQSKILDESQGWNVVFLGHGSQDGFFSTYNNFILSNTVLKQMAEIKNIKRMIFYSCFPKDLALKYSKAFNKLIDNSKEIYFAVPIGMFEGIQLLDLEVFPHFIHKIIDQIHNKDFGN